MRSLILAVTAVLAIGTAASAMNVSGVITSDQTWRMDTPADTVRVLSNITISSGATVTIEPGTVIRGYKSSGGVQKYNVNISGSGKIQANGTPDNMIKFRNVCVEFIAITDDANNWLKGCSFSSGWGHSLVEFRNPSDPDSTVPNEQSEILIEDCHFTNGAYCMTYITSGARPAFRRCTFENSNGAAIFSHGADDMIVDSCVFRSVSAAFCCGGMSATKRWWEPLVVRVNHCTFYDINKQNTNGFTTVKIANDYGITTLNWPGSLYVHNSIFQNIGESGIRDWNVEDANFDTNWEIVSDYNMYYDLGGDPVRLLDMGTNSQEADPLFTDAVAGDFSLQAGSPALSAGNDGLNMGAVQNSSGSSVGVLPAGMPAEGISIVVRQTGRGIVFNLSETMPGELVIYDAAGNELARIGMRERSSAVWQAAADAGVYYVRLTTDPAGAVVPFIKM